MRTYTPQFDQGRLAKLNPEPWMLEVLGLNPSYVHWGPHEDYMCNKNSQWGSPLFFKSWVDHTIELDDLNEVVHYYFEVKRDTKDCTCENGYSAYATRFKEEQPYYRKDVPKSRLPGERLTDEALQVLFERKRICTEGVNPSTKDLRQVALDRGNMLMDSMSIHTLLDHECRKQGVPLTCSICDGDGRVYLETPAYLSLVYWLLHPRKGAGRGVEVNHIEREQLPEVYRFLSQAAERNAKRFEKVVARACGI